MTNVQNTVTKVDGKQTYDKNSKYYKYNLEFNVNGYDFAFMGYTPQFSANASKLVNSKGNKVVASGKSVTLAFIVADYSDARVDTAIFVKGNSVNFVDADEKVYTVTYDPNGGTCDITSAQTGTDGTLDILPVAVFEGDEFIGWFVSPYGDGEEQITVDTVFDKDSTVYAIWKKHKVSRPTPDSAEYTDVTEDANSNDNGVPQTGETNVAGFALISMIVLFTTFFFVYRSRKSK